MPAQSRDDKLCLGTIAGFASRRKVHFYPESKTDEMPDFAQSRKVQFYLLTFKNPSFTQRSKNSMVSVEKTGYNQCPKIWFCPQSKGGVTESVEKVTVLQPFSKSSFVGLLCWNLLGKGSQSGEWDVNIYRGGNNFYFLPPHKPGIISNFSGHVI